MNKMNQVIYFGMIFGPNCMIAQYLHFHIGIAQHDDKETS